MQIMSVAQFVQYLNDTFKAIWDINEVAIEGEVSGFRVSQGQWVNFDLKDEEALISSFMVLAKLGVPLEDGMRVRVFGYPRVYPKYGKFSINVERVELIGEGALRKALAALRAKLEAEGLFDPTRKRALPRFPSRIALVASRESAAYGDFIRIINERWKGLHIDVYHVLVQGERAPDSIAQAIQRAQSEPYDALVLTRGGGSFEELMAFNDERVVRALYASKIPTLVGIGHERDLSLAEEVADVRGSTPTDCARRLVLDRRDVLYELSALQDQAAGAMERLITQHRSRIERMSNVIQNWFASLRYRYDLAIQSHTHAVDVWVRQLRERIESARRVLDALDPTRVLARGYAWVTDASGRVRSSVGGWRVGEEAHIRLADGELTTRITRTQEQGGAASIEQTSLF